MPLTLRHANSPLLPLSEDERLVLPSSRGLVAGLEDQDQVSLGAWDDVTEIRRGEKRNIAVHIRVKHNTEARMVRVFVVPTGARLTLDHVIEVDLGARWNGTILVRGGGEIRLRRVVHVLGPEAQVELNTLVVLEKTGQVSGAAEIFCDQPTSSANIRMRFILKDEAQGIARARLVMGEHAQGSMGGEELHTLVLGDKAQVRTIPELEVLNDQTVCHHAASNLPLDAEQVFSLASRGLAPKEVTAVLSRSFAAPVLDRVPAELRAQSEQVLFR